MRRVVRVRIIRPWDFASSEAVESDFGWLGEEGEREGEEERESAEWISVACESESVLGCA